MRWVPKKWYAAQDVIVLGGGPSLKGFDWKRLVPHIVIGCNDAYQLGTAVTNVCVFGDMPWYLRHREQLARWPNPVVTNQPSLHVSKIEWLLTLRRDKTGLSKTGLSWNQSTGATAINLALLLGAQRVLLLGFDCKTDVEGNTNYHANNIGNPNSASYARFKKGFRTIAESLPGTYPDREIINLGPDSAVDAFPQADINNFIE